MEGRVRQNPRKLRNLRIPRRQALNLDSNPSGICRLGLRRWPETESGGWLDRATLVVVRELAGELRDEGDEGGRQAREKKKILRKKEERGEAGERETEKMN